MDRGMYIFGKAKKKNNKMYLKLQKIKTKITEFSQWILFFRIVPRVPAFFEKNMYRERERELRERER
jgi:hypothetical protein